MSNKSPEKSKSYKTASIFFLIGGLIFIIVGAVSSRIGSYLPIGIALVIISLAFWQHSKKLADNERKNSAK